MSEHVLENLIEMNEGAHRMERRSSNAPRKRSQTEFLNVSNAGRSYSSSASSLATATAYESSVKRTKNSRTSTATATATATAVSRPTGVVGKFKQRSIFDMIKIIDAVEPEKEINRRLEVPKKIYDSKAGKGEMIMVQVSCYQVARDFGEMVANAFELKKIMEDGAKIWVSFDEYQKLRHEFWETHPASRDVEVVGGGLEGEKPDVRVDSDIEVCEDDEIEVEEARSSPTKMKSRSKVYDHFTCVSQRKDNVTGKMCRVWKHNQTKKIIRQQVGGTGNLTAYLKLHGHIFFPPIFPHQSQPSVPSAFVAPKINRTAFSPTKTR